MKALAALLNAKKRTEEDFSNKPVGAPKQPVDIKKRKITALQWTAQEAYCGDEVALQAFAEGMPADTQGNAQLLLNEQPLTMLKTQGQTEFKLPWQVAALPLPAGAEDEQTIHARFTAGGEIADTEQPLKINRLLAGEPVPATLQTATGQYQWASVAGIAVENGELVVEVKMRLKKAWRGHWIRFDPQLDGHSGWAWVKKAGTVWKYWNQANSPHHWSDLPRDITTYTIYPMLFVYKDGRFVSRHDDHLQWPEAFQNTDLFKNQAQAWLQRLLHHWDNRFAVKRVGCDNADVQCCRWRLRFKIATVGKIEDNIVYIVEGEPGEFSHFNEWYLRDPRSKWVVHAFGHWLGAKDEYDEGANDGYFQYDEQSIMGREIDGEIQVRHLKSLMKEIRTHLCKWAGRAWQLELIRLA